MDQVHFSFETTAFTDTKDKLAENVNGITGFALADWLGAALKTKGFTVTGIDPEDHGWTFGVKSGAASFVVTCSVTDEGTPHESHVDILKYRSMSDKVFGRNRLAPDDPLVAAVRSILAGAPQVQKLNFDQR